MKIHINKTLKVLENKFLSQWYPLEIAISMSKSLIASELFWKKTHWVTRYNWILKNNISKEYLYTPSNISNTLSFIDCSWKNGYYIAQKEVEDICHKLTKQNSHQTRILKNVFPTNALIEYLEKFHSENIGAIIISTTPRLVWLRWSGKRIVGTNPIWYTFPNDQSIILADLSTSNVPLGKIIEKSNQIKERIVLDADWETRIPKQMIDNQGNFIWSLLPFWWIDWEHKGLSISLLIELISSSLAGTRSEMWDMIIFAFSKDHPIYKSKWVNELISSLIEIEVNLRFPWWESYIKYNQNIKNWYIDIDEHMLQSLSLSQDELNIIKYEK